MQQAAQKIAATYSVDPAGWKKAADDIRQPYWDWAVNSTPPNEVISLKQVTIVGPSGQKVTVDNPLYHYTFHPIDSSFRGRYGLWQTTLRQPTNSSGSATDNVSLLRKFAPLIALPDSHNYIPPLAFFTVGNPISPRALTTC